MVVSQVIGLLAKSLTGSTFGTGVESEAFFAANRFSEILFNLIAGGALGSAFIPTFTGLLTNTDRRRAWELASAICNWLVIVLTFLSLLSVVFAPQIVRYILAPGFSQSDPAKEALTIQLLRVQLPSVVIFGLSGLVMGILNAHQHFLLPALAPAMYSIGWIFGLIVLVPSQGVFGLAWGVVIGAALHLLLQLPGLVSLPARRYSLNLGLGMQEVRTVITLMGPRLLGVAVVQLNFLLNTYLASLQPEGSLTGISLAFPLMIMPQAAIAQSIAIAALPTFSAQAARGKLDEMRSSLAATLRGVLLLAIPASLGLILLRRPLVQLIYQRGEFDMASVLLVTWPLLWYAAGLIGHAIVEIVSRAFYALKDTRTPVFIGVLAMTLNLLFSLLFTFLFKQIGWAPHGGLALANSLATGLESIGLLYLMRRKLNGLVGGKIWRGVLLAGIAALVMGGVVLLWLTLADNMAPVLVTLGGVVVGGAAYGLVLTLLRADEVKIVLSSIRRRFSK